MLGAVEPATPASMSEPVCAASVAFSMKRPAVVLLLAIAVTSCSSARTGATDWDLVALPSGTSVVIRVWVGDGCHKLIGVEQHEDASSVELVARVHSSG